MEEGLYAPTRRIRSPLASGRKAPRTTKSLNSRPENLQLAKVSQADVLEPVVFHQAILKGVRVARPVIDADPLGLVARDDDRPETVITAGGARKRPRLTFSNNCNVCLRCENAMPIATSRPKLIMPTVIALM